jgi:hypothetical protein
VGRDQMKTAAGFRDRHAKYQEISKQLEKKWL